MSSLRLSCLVVIACVASSACSSTVVTEAPDATPAVDSGSAPAADTGTELAPCDPAITSVEVEEALLSKDPSAGTAVWILRARGGKTNVTVTLRESAGAKVGASTGSFGEEQLTLSRAPLSFVLQTDCNLHGDHYHCGPSYVPESGTWSVTALEGTVGGTFDIALDADLREAKVSGGLARPVDGGKTLCVRKLRLAGKLSAL